MSCWRSAGPTAHATSDFLGSAIRLIDGHPSGASDLSCLLHADLSQTVHSEPGREGGHATPVTSTSPRVDAYCRRCPLRILSVEPTRTDSVASAGGAKRDEGARHEVLAAMSAAAVTGLGPTGAGADAFLRIPSTASTAPTISERSVSSSRRTSTVALSMVGLLEERKLSQAGAAKVLGVSQPKVSALRTYKLAGFSVERLMNLLTALDQDVEIVIRKKPHSRRAARISVVAA